MANEALNIKANSDQNPAATYSRVNHLANFSGVLQADAYAGFNALYVDGTIQKAAFSAPNWTEGSMLSARTAKIPRGGGQF